jgi:hypothetical protein
VADLIAAATAKAGLTVQCERDEQGYAKRMKVTDAELAPVNIEGDPWHPEWNDTVKPRPSNRIDRS